MIRWGFIHQGIGGPRDAARDKASCFLVGLIFPSLEGAEFSFCRAQTQGLPLEIAMAAAVPDAAAPN